MDSLRVFLEMGGVCKVGGMPAVSGVLGVGVSPGKIPLKNGFSGGFPPNPPNCGDTPSKRGLSTAGNSAILGLSTASRGVFPHSGGTKRGETPSRLSMLDLTAWYLSKPMRGMGFGINTTLISDL